MFLQSSANVVINGKLTEFDLKNGIITAEMSSGWFLGSGRHAALIKLDKDLSKILAIKFRTKSPHTFSGRLIKFNPETRNFQFIDNSGKAAVVYMNPSLSREFKADFEKQFKRSYVMIQKKPLVCKMVFELNKIHIIVEG